MIEAQDSNQSRYDPPAESVSSCGPWSSFAPAAGHPCLVRDSSPDSVRPRWPDYAFGDRLWRSDGRGPHAKAMPKGMTNGVMNVSLQRNTAIPRAARSARCRHVPCLEGKQHGREATQSRAAAERSTGRRIRRYRCRRHGQGRVAAARRAGEDAWRLPSEVVSWLWRVRPITLAALLLCFFKNLSLPPRLS